jgi:small subunit ribosomal protein S6
LRRYETVVIAHVDLSEDELSGVIARYGGIVTAQKGILVKAERWGKRKLAYLIGKQTRGFYILIDYAGTSAVVTELERNLKIDDKILKFMTILKADAVDPDALAKEIAEGAKKEEKKDEKAVATAHSPEAVPAIATVASGASGVQDDPSAVPEETNTKEGKES